jgi:hypothetical protein
MATTRITAWAVAFFLGFLERVGDAGAVGGVRAPRAGRRLAGVPDSEVIAVFWPPKAPVLYESYHPFARW